MSFFASSFFTSLIAGLTHYEAVLRSPSADDCGIALNDEFNLNSEHANGQKCRVKDCNAGETERKDLFCGTSSITEKLFPVKVNSRAHISKNEKTSC